MGRLTDDYDKLDFLGWDLELDHVVTAWQARRWYGVTQQQLQERGFLLDRRQIKRTRNTNRIRSVAFVMVDPKYQAYTDVALYHLAGTAEIRYALGVGHVLQGGPQEWSSTAWREVATMVPDALWERPNGSRIAIEFDATYYKNDRLAAKAERFSSFDGQVWGAPTLTRVEVLRERVAGVDPRARVVLADPLAGG